MNTKLLATFAIVVALGSALAAGTIMFAQQASATIHPPPPKETNPSTGNPHPPGEPTGNPHQFPNCSGNPHGDTLQSESHECHGAV